MLSNEFDVLIIGSGPGGYVAAIRAAQLGLKTAVIEKSHLGGICLNWGCIPTKALLRSAEILHLVTHAKEFGIVVPKPTIDLPSLIDRSRRVSGQLNSGVQYLLHKNNVQVIWGEAKVAGAGRVVVREVKKATAPKGALGAGNYLAKHIIIATGARPRALKGVGASDEKIWSYFEAMTPKALPAKLLIIGAGAIGIEFASFYRSLGSEVTVIEALDRILPLEDSEISAMARDQLAKRGIKFLTSSQIIHLADRNEFVTADIQTQSGAVEKVTVDKVIVAIGVTGNVEELGLESLGVKIEKGKIPVDAVGRTNLRGIYAIGDVSGPPMLAHKAEHEGIRCVEAIAGIDRGTHKEQVPSCIYSTPQIASVGLSEEAARSLHGEIRVGRFPFKASGKAIALGETEGLIKVIFDKKTGELLGAHMIGQEVTELIQGYLLAMKLETTEQQFFETIFPHPSLSEMMKEAALQAYGRSING
jgi:dihydrolipoamide dehydrogenase